MFILVLYATTNGQTRKIARHAADRLVALGHSIEMLNAADATDLDPGVHDAAVLAGSVHAGRFQSSLGEAMRRHGVALAAKPTLFLSVSLTAAGDVPEERAELDALTERFFQDVGWTPRRVAQIAGAVKFTDYDFFRYWALRWIVRNRDPGVTGREDVEYTNWAALTELVTDWAAEAAS